MDVILSNSTGIQTLIKNWKINYILDRKEYFMKCLYYMLYHIYYNLAWHRKEYFIFTMSGFNPVEIIQVEIKILPYMRWIIEWWNYAFQFSYRSSINNDSYVSLTRTNLSGHGWEGFMSIDVVNAERLTSAVGPICFFK